MKQGIVTMNGEVIKVLANAFYLVEVDDTGIESLCRLCGKMTKRFIKPLQKDRVVVEFSETDFKNGRIMRRI